MTRQRAFSFEWPQDMRLDDYAVSDANRLAYEAVTRPHDWPFFCTVIAGGQSSGKTHLSHIFAAETGAVLVTLDNLGQPHWQYHRAYAVDGLEQFVGDTSREEGLFHLFNAARANNDRLLITTAIDLQDLTFTIPDLQSRLLGSTLITLDYPDEDILTALYAKFFHDRQILVKNDVIAYLVTHMDRSYANAHYLVQSIDQWALATGKPVTIPVVKQFLDNIYTTEKSST